jgi:hypothetical protein
MTVERGRILDPQAVEAAEYLRKNDKVVQAAKIATKVLGGPQQLFDERFPHAILSDPEQTAILACLARIQVDSLKTIANKTVRPSVILDKLSIASITIDTIENDPAFKRAISNMDFDHRERVHHFGAEIPRDIQKTAKAASVLYGKSEHDELILWGEELLEQTYQRLPDYHPTKPLIAVELTLSKLSRGEKIEKSFLLGNFNQLVSSDEETNPHRVATVASWMVVVGDMVEDEQINQEGMKVFSRMIENHPEWDFMIPNERNKRINWERRKRIVQAASHLITSRGSRRNLKRTLMRYDPNF